MLFVIPKRWRLSFGSNSVMLEVALRVVHRQRNRLRMSETIDYGNLMHEAMRGLIQNVLQDVAANGLPGEHHFFITFDTLQDDVKIADWLSDRYPEEMTIVVQHWFDDLDVSDQGFSITLNFGDNPENLYVPFDALKTFVDPSVEFGLRFESQSPQIQEAAETTPELVSTEPAAAKGDGHADDDTDGDEVETSHDGDVVSLDSFRK